MSSNRLNELYSYLTIKNNVDNIDTLKKFLLQTGHKDLLANVIEILHECDLSKIDLEPIIKICLLKGELKDDEFTVLYHSLATQAIKYLSYHSILTIHQYIKDRPILMKDKLLLQPIYHNGDSDIDLNFMEPNGHVSYLIDIDDISKIEKQINQQTNRNRSISPMSLFKRYTKSEIDLSIDMLLNILKKYPNVTIAGGFPMMILDGTIDTRTDMDIFIYGKNREETAKKIIMEMYETIPFPIYHQVTNSVINFWLEGSWIRPQIILSNVDDVFELLFDFDLSYNSIAYTPFKQQFEGTLDGLYAIKTRTTFITKESIKPGRLLKAYYKNYRVIKYRPFVLSENPGSLEIFQDDKLNLNNLKQIMTKDDFEYGYLIPSTKNSTHKNAYDLRRYYKDDRISSDKVNLDTINYKGICHSNYGHQSIDTGNHVFMKEILEGDKLFKQHKDISRNISLFRLNLHHHTQSTMVKIIGVYREINRENKGENKGKLMYIDVIIPDGSFKDTLNLIVDKAIIQFGEFGSKPKKKQLNEKNTGFDLFRFKVREDFIIYDINHIQQYPRIDTIKNMFKDDDLTVEEMITNENVLMNFKNIQVVKDTSSYLKNDKNKQFLSFVLSSIQLFNN